MSYLDDHHRVSSRRKVGFYGCGQLVRVELSDPAEKVHPRFARVDCPACGMRHRVQLSWRNYNERIDHDRDPALRLEVHA